MRTILVQPQRTTFPFFSHLLATVLLLFQGAAFGQETITLTADPSYLTGDGSGLQNWEDGVTLQAINLDGTPGRVAFETRFSDDGFGVAGARWDQIDFYEEAGNRSEQLIIDFGGPVTNVTLTTGMLGAGEGPGNENDDETGLWRAFDGEGAQVAEGLIGPELSDLGPNVKYEGTYGKYPIRLPSERPFHSVVIEATGFGHGLGRSEQRRYGENNSDFNIMEVSYVRASAGSDNRPPVAMDDDFFEIREDIGLTGIQYSTLLDNDSDPDGDSFLITGFDFTGFPGTIEDFPGDQEILFTTAENFSGLIQFTYTISDGNATSTATISINVINLLDDPVVVQDGPFSTLINEALTLPMAELLANDFDPDGEEIALQSVGEAVNGTVEVQADVVLFTPDSDFVGQASFVYTIISGESFPASTTSEPIVIDVLPSAPSINGNFVLVPKSDEGLYLQVDATSNRTSAVVQDCDDGIFWTITDRGDGYHKITSDFAGKALEAWQRVPRNGDDVTIYSDNNRDWQRWEIIDAGDGYFKIKGKYNPRFLTFSGMNANVQNENFLDNQLWRLVDVDGFVCNSKPVAVGEELNVRGDEEVVISVADLLANDSDPDGDTLSITEVENVRGLGELISFDGEEIVYVAFSTGALLRYTVSDGRGGTDQEFVFFNTFSNLPPVAEDDDFFEIREDIGLTGIQYSTLLRNDTDPEGDAIRVTGFDFADFPGTIENFPEDEEVLFTTEQDFSGEIRFTYTITDGQNTDEATIVITVINLLDDPIVGPDGPFNTTQDVPLTIPIQDLLSNDFDPDGEEVRFLSVSGAINGSVEASGDLITFTPTTGFVGQGSFVYSVISGTTFTGTASSDPIVIDILQPKPSLNGTFFLSAKSDASTFLRVNSTANRASAILGGCGEGVVWEVSDRGNGFHKIFSPYAEKALEAWRRTPQNGDDVTIYASNDRDWQQWEILEAGDGFFEIRGKYNPRLLTSSSGNAIVWDADDSEGQLWQFIPIAESPCASSRSLEIEEASNLPTRENVVTVYPNPVTERVRVRWDGLEEGAELLLVDGNGRIVRRVHAATFRTEINMAGLTRGTYFLHGPNNMGIMKILKE